MGVDQGAPDLGPPDDRHQQAQRGPDVRVVYVDNDPIVQVHSRALLANHPGVVALHHDIRDPAGVLEHPAVRAHLDFDRPIALLMISVLHFVDPGVAPKATRRYIRALPPGSYVAASMASTEGVDPALIAHLESVYRQSASPLIMRTRAQVEELFDTATMLPPGLVDVGQWCNPDPDVTVLGGMLAGLARKD